MKDKKDTNMLKEYDFRGGVRGKYAKAYQKGSNVVILDPDVVKEFPDSRSVNNALKYLIKIIKDHKMEKNSKIF